MSSSNDPSGPAVDQSETFALSLLDVLAGRWASHGRTVATDTDPSADIEGYDDYAWVAGGQFMLHTVDVHVGEEHVRAIEVMGELDPGDQTYAVRSFDHLGAVGMMRIGRAPDGSFHLVGETERSRVVVDEDGLSMQARWERTTDGERWHHWMDMSFTKIVA